MSRWINIDDLPTSRVEWDDIFDAPSIDIVRCKECKWYDGTAYSNVRCRCLDRAGNMKGLIECTDDDFCSYGEKQTERSE